MKRQPDWLARGIAFLALMFTCTNIWPAAVCGLAAIVCSVVHASREHCRKEGDVKDINLWQCKICLAEIPVNQGHACSDTPPGRKDDGGKDPWHLLPWQAARQIVHVLEFGRKKYGANNWQGVENHRERYFSAAIRHLTAWYNGEECDAESGIHHLAHAGCCVVFLLWFELNGQSRV